MRCNKKHTATIRIDGDCDCKGQKCDDCQNAERKAREAREQQERIAREAESKARQLQRQIAELQKENQEKEQEIKKLNEQNQKLEKQVAEKDKEIENLKKENEELQSIAKQWKLVQSKEKREKFMQKTKEEGWDIRQSSEEDIQFLFEEFEILDLLEPLKTGCPFARLFRANIGSAVDFLGIDYVKASKLMFSIELMANGIYSKEDKEKHLKDCSICRMEVKKGLEEYGVPAKDSAVIAAKLSGMHMGEIKNLTASDCIKLGIEKSLCFTLETSLETMKEIHSFA